MCVSCGCGKPNDAHGDNRNITMDDLNRAADAAGITPDQVAQNITQTAAGGTGMRSSQSQMGGQSMGRQTSGDYGQQSQGRGFDQGMGDTGFGQSSRDRDADRGFDRL